MSEDTKNSVNSATPNFPARLVRACRAFFSLEPEWQEWHVPHPFWKASLYEMCDGVFRAFEQLRRRYFTLPTLADEASFFEFADRVDQQEQDDEKSAASADIPHTSTLQTNQNNESKQGPFRSVALVGEIKNGKSTIADYLRARFGFSEYAFAGPLKRGVGILFGFSYDQLWDEVLKETVDKRWGVTPRYLLLKIGTEMFRDDLVNLIPNVANNFKQTVWIANMFLHVQRASKVGGTGIVISDCRFPDEADAVRQIAMLVVRVVRPNIAKTAVASTHASETSQKLIVPDMTILNDGTLEQLYEKVEKDLLPKICQE